MPKNPAGLSELILESKLVSLSENDLEVWQKFWTQAQKLFDHPHDTVFEKPFLQRRELRIICVLLHRALQEFRDKFLKTSHQKTVRLVTISSFLILVLSIGGGLFLGTPKGQGKWRGQYFSNEQFSGDPIIRMDDNLSFYWGKGPPLESIPVDNFSVRWESCLMLNKDKKAHFMIGADNDARVFIDEKELIDSRGPVELKVTEKKLPLKKGVHFIRVDYVEKTHGASVWLRASFDGGAPTQIGTDMLFAPLGKSHNPCKR